MKMLRNVVCLLDGSTDSFIVGLLLKKEGFNVIGLAVENKYISRERNNSILERSEKICKDVLQIPWTTYTPNIKETGPFHRAIADDLKNGLEPHVDILYHKFMTFGCVFEHAVHSIGSDAFATPHYVQTEPGRRFDGPNVFEGVRLLRAWDRHHDESFHLSQIVQKTLQRCLFPLGSIPRDVVLSIAKSKRIPIEKNKGVPDSFGAADVESLLPTDMRNFDKIAGNLVNVTNRETIGSHDDLHQYSIGSKHEFGSATFYVVEKDTQTGDVFMARDPLHPAAFTDTLFTTLANWTYNIPYKFYHQQQMMDTQFSRGLLQGPDSSAGLNKCTLTIGNMTEWCGNDHLILSSSAPMHAVTPGKFCAFYQGDECIGSGKIKRAGPSHYAMNYHKYKHLVDNEPTGQIGSSASIGGLPNSLRNWVGKIIPL